MNENTHSYSGEASTKTPSIQSSKSLQRWLDDAKAAGIHLSEAMTLATATAETADRPRGWYS